MASKVIVALGKAHNTKAFDCGIPELNAWLQNTASQHQKNGISKTFVLPEPGQEEQIAGFFAMAMRGLVLKENLPEDMQKKLPQKVPGFTLARLAVSKEHQGKGLGGYLLMEAMERAQRASDSVGGFALFVDAKEGAAAFYAKFGFRPLPSDPTTLVLPMASMPRFPVQEPQ